jgi:hypothetical protein
MRIEHIDQDISCIWFCNNHREEEQEHVPNEFALYNSNNEIVLPFRNTQSYAISKNGNYTVKYCNKTIVILSTICHPTMPPIIKNVIEVVIETDD